jgi:hypothetical protein
MSLFSAPTTGHAKGEKKGKELPPNLAKEEVTTALDARSSDGPSARLRKSPSKPRQAKRPPTVRLTSVAVMDKVDQQRLELLLDHLIERRVRDIIRREGP